MRKAGVQSDFADLEAYTLTWDKRESFGNAMGGNPSKGIHYTPEKKVKRNRKQCKGRKTPKARVTHQHVMVYTPTMEVRILRPLSIRQAEKMYPTARKVELLTKSGIVLMSQAIGLGRITA